MRNINVAMECSYFSPPQYSFPPLESKLIRVGALKYVKSQLIYIFSVCSLTSMPAKVKINHLKSTSTFSILYLFTPLLRWISTVLGPEFLKRWLNFTQKYGKFQARFSHLRTPNSRSQNTSTVEPLL